MSDDNTDYLKGINEAVGKLGPPVEFNYEERDVLLYNLGIGSTAKELKYVNEGDEDFQVIPTFGVLPGYNADQPFSLPELVPNFNPMKLLHGEQYLEIRTFPIPTSANLVSRAQLIEVVDKGNASVLKTGLTVSNPATGQDVFYTESSAFLRGSGGFGGKRAPADRGNATAANNAPKRAPDFIKEFQTGVDQAALFRLSGDYNPLHIDPSFAEMGGFKKPILHGLCTFGVAGKSIYDKYGPFKNMKVRFAGTVDPGQTIVTEMWKEGNKIIFQCKVKETGKMAIVSGGAELAGSTSSKL